MLTSMIAGDLEAVVEGAHQGILGIVMEKEAFIELNHELTQSERQVKELIGEEISLIMLTSIGPSKIGECIMKREGVQQDTTCYSL